jgi:hypothetical protein
MNLEKDSSPTGLYNYLPKMNKTRRRRRSKSRNSRRKSRGSRVPRTTIKYGRKKSS